MNKKSIDEMEQIQKGLEQFLEQELAACDEKKDSPDGCPPGGGRGPGTGHPSRAGQGTDRRSQQKNNSAEPPLFYTISPEEEDEDSYWEDWDTKEEDLDEDLGEDMSGGMTQKAGKRQQAGKDKCEPEGLKAGGGRHTGKKQNGTEGRQEHRRKPSRQENMRNAGRDEAQKKPGRKAKRTSEPEVSRKGKRPDKPEAGGRKKKRSRLKGFLAIVVILGLLLGYGWYALVGMVYDKMTYEKVEALAGEPMKADNVINILLIGNDSRENGEDGRSDAMILLSISSRTKTIYMTSLLRDMYVDIPGRQGNRLNAAYSFGGAELLLETVEQNFDIQVNRYMLVNFQAFANLVDAVGGVELELTNEEVQYVNGYLVEYNILTGRPEGTDYLDASLSGKIHLNGPQALAYTRNRYLGTDFGRTERQRKVLTAVIAKTPAALLTNPKGLLDGVLSNLTTNLTRGECLELSLLAGKLLTYDIIQDSIPIEGSYENAKIRGMAVLKVDFEKNRKYLQDTIYGKAPRDK